MMKPTLEAVWEASGKDRLAAAPQNHTFRISGGSRGKWPEYREDVRSCDKTGVYMSPRGTVLLSLSIFLKPTLRYY
jgi:hypothetical protein